MKITTIQISGFRKILKATINMEDDITVIAGANNSGKTSIVELFNYVFNAKGALCSDDFPVYESQEWCTAVFPYFQAQFKQENSILSAYKLFYVGCSRARRNLTILLDSSKIKGNLEPQKKRFEEIGFQVVSSPIH